MRAGVALLLFLLAAGAFPGTPFYAEEFSAHPSARALATLGRQLFFEPSLSASGTLSCASCHDPRHDFAAPNARAVQRGGRDGRQAGVRAVPSLMYAQGIPPFTEHHLDDEGDDGVDQGPAGGRTWDGRAQSAHEQAELPLRSAFEMANAEPDAVLERLRRGPSGKLFGDTFGAAVFDTPMRAWRGLLLALETFQQDPALFYPYSSKYDAYLKGDVSLSAAEARGLAVFNDPSAGNCARCHPSAARGGALPVFTDYGYAALGVPRNRSIARNRDPGYVDLGLCGPYRTDLAQHPEYCGLFRTPTLRNVARRSVFFHNGVITTLREAVAFYALRDLDPRYRALEDLPAAYRGNLERLAPFKARAKATPSLSEAQIEDLIAFLNTLSDGWSAASPASQR